MPRDAIWNRDSPLWTRFFSLPGGRELDAKAEKELQEVREPESVEALSFGAGVCMGVCPGLPGSVWVL